MTTWRIAGVQMDVVRGQNRHNLEQMCLKLREAAEHGARLAIFPECALPGYCFDSKEEAWPYAEPLPGPASEAFTRECRELNVFAIFGMLEAVPATGQMFNTAALIGPDGLVVGYRKIHLPFLGVDRFTTPGDRPFAVHDLGGLRVGMTICYDGSFPESARVLMLAGADLVVLPTNWPTGALSTAKYIIQARALENTIYYAAVNRIGHERGFDFIGHSRIVDCNGEFLAVNTCADAEILYADIEPERARKKEIVKIPGKYVLHRIADRRPEMYGPLTR